LPIGRDFAFGHYYATLLILQATMADFIEVARLDQIQQGTGSRFTVVGKDVAVFNVDGNLFAIADTCPHAGGALGMGKLNGKIVMCPVHGMKFDVTTGCFSGSTDFGVASYPVKVMYGKIMVAVS
jgi:nitrite reductase/ring-hydroxylating ferredoxin subunit